MSDEALNRINELRQRVIAGEQISIEEAKEAIALLRQRRMASLTKLDKGKQSTVPLNLNELFEKKDGPAKDIK